MALDYRRCAQEIFSHLGGRENIISAAHCATRLRLVIADNSKVDKKELEDVEGVKGMFESNGQLQLIIGTGTVNKVYDEFLDITGMTAATKADVKAAAAARQPLPKRLIKVLGDVFVPILPAIVASGLMMGLVEAIGKASPAFVNSDWYSFLDMVSGAAFAYLPVIIAISTARVFGGNIFLGAVVGLCMIHSNLINAWAVSGMKASQIPVWHLLCFHVKAVGYQGHVIPVIIAVWIMCMVEKWLHKHVPEMLDLFVTPLCTVLFTTFITFTIIGPIFSTAETYILHGAQLLITVGHGIGAAAMGAIYPVTVVMGLHHMYNVIEAGMLAEKNGLNIWMPIATAANFAQFGACLAVAVKTKSHKRREIAFPSSLSASLGITEPAIFGVNLRLMKPFVCGMIGGAVGAWFGSISHLGAKAYGVTGIPGLLTINHIPLYLVELAIAGGIAFALTMVIWKEDPAEQDHPKGEEDVLDALVEEKEEPNKEMPVLIRCEAGEVHAPAYGQIIPREEIKDETFASGVLGDGVGIEPEVGLVVAPFDGEIANVAETGHAIGLEGPGDMELLIHIGVDTVKMKGKGFHPLVKEGDHVTAGQKLLEFDRDEIAKAGFPDTVVVLLTNSDDYEDVKCYGDLQKEEE
ncbi:MAG: glucose PTS transporter subunit IIA [Eubacterium sp.]|jgi:PTS system sucrose-specific IIC component|nr:glucose PTS transporter subunit IIA [Eubacterium sp.]MCH4078629.1 glucose PTS transporter subunit IIA [Eubacterium sp.]MCH4109770.1 glucose PTS transporter subunit IIA [Eubacterium sp.]MCI1306978.1 glucose PTS transporter subunit IIA [Eubacterium sp.]MCI1428104.1 glucose PTS transporter subunit IIA [Eubacterium sp.]